MLIDILPNRGPTVAKANVLQLVSVGAAFDLDTLQGGATFSADPDGDVLTHQVTLSEPSRGLSISGTRVRGTFTQPGAVRVRVIARDGFGANATEEFVLAAPANPEGRPRLPAIPFTYDDAKLPLPASFRQSSISKIPLWDTQPADNRTTDAGAALGRVLFYDRRLSSTNTHSCSSCHEQARGFANGTRLSTGITGETGTRNAMSLTNVRYNIHDAYFADMRVHTLESLALMPILDRVELGNSLPNLVEKLAATDFYPPLFEAAFGTRDVTAERIARALAQFLRALISYTAKVDQAENLLEGVRLPDPATVFTAQELAGRQLFIDNRCGHCHAGTARTMSNPANNGLDAVVTDPGAGRGEFRVTSLRNVAVSAPYMHDGRFATLREVVDHYDSGVKFSPTLSGLLLSQNGEQARLLNLSAADKDALIAFMETFTDQAFLADPRFADPFAP